MFGWIIKTIIGLALVGGAMYYHQEIYDEIMYQIEDVDSDYDSGGDNDYAYDDYDTESDW
jgi:hypothetical protein